jgi:aspartate/methionine/tyrosine aminotransferase
MAIAREARKISSSVRIVVDEVYHDFVSARVLPAATLDDCFISLNSLTKVYGLGSLHTGWIIADPETIVRVKQLQTLVEGSGARLLEAFVSTVIENLDEYWDRSAGLMSENRALLHRYLQPLMDDSVISGEIPEYGYIHFPQVQGVARTDELVGVLAGKHSVYVVPGRFFGEPGGLRIGFGGRTDSLNRSLEVLSRALR